MKQNWFIGLGVLALVTSCNDPKGQVENDTLAEATADTAVMYDDDKGEIDADGVEILKVDEAYWDNVNWDAPVVDDADLKAAEIEKQETENQVIFTMDDRLLFDTDKAELRTEGEAKLKQVADEIKALPENSQIRVFGHTDARGSNEYNKELSAERAKAVQEWLKTKAGINGNRITIEAMGETDPRASNETAKGRQLNRRVAIVVAKK